MARDTQRRGQLAEAATDYALEHGLLGLSLRPLAAALGTSDRMLLYHFSSKDDLVATVLRTANSRAVAHIRSLPPSPGLRAAVHELWQAVRTESVDRCQRMYVEAAALGLLGREPYASSVREANAHWTTAIADHLVESGVEAERAARVVVLVDAAFMGFQLDLPLDVDPADRRRAVADLADAVEAVGG